MKKVSSISVIILILINNFLLAQAISYNNPDKVCMIKFKVDLPNGESATVTQILGRTSTVDFDGKKFGISPTNVDNEKGTVQFDLQELSSKNKENMNQNSVLKSLWVGNKPVITTTDPAFTISIEDIIFK